MHRALRFSLVLLILPAIAAAATPTQQKSFLGSNDQCIDSIVGMKEGKVAEQAIKQKTYQSCQEQKCTFDKEKKNLCVCGRVTISGPDGKPIVNKLDKCDPKTRKLIAATESASGMKDLSAYYLAQNAAQNVDLTTEQGRQQASAVLQAFGVEQTQAEKIVKESPDQAKQVLQALASGDKDEVQTAADNAGLTLNEDIVNNISSMSPQKIAQKFDSLYTEDQKVSLNTILNAPDTFGTADTDAKKVTEISPELSSYVDRLTGHGCNNNNLSCRTNNPGAMTWAPWEGKYGGAPCGERNNTTCFPDAASGLAAKIDLISRKIQSGCNTLYTILENCQYSSRSAGNDSYAYAITVGRVSGLGPHTTIDPNNAEQMGKLVTAMAWYEGGRGIGFNSRDLQQALKMYYSGELPQGDPNFTPGTRFAYTVPGPLSYNPSPFASVTPVGYGGYTGYGYGSSYPYAVSTGYPVSTGNPVSTGGTVSTGGVVSVSAGGTILSGAVPSGTAASSAPAPAPAPAVATLLVQPKTVVHDTSATVSWSSVGMRTDVPCQLYADGTFMAQGNGGSRSFDTRSVLAGKTVTFSLQCAPGSGAAKVTQNATLQVQ